MQQTTDQTRRQIADLNRRILRVREELDEMAETAFNGANPLRHDVEELWGYAPGTTLRQAAVNHLDTLYELGEEVRRLEDSLECPGFPGHCRSGRSATVPGGYCPECAGERQGHYDATGM